MTLEQDTEIQPYPARVQLQPDEPAYGLLMRTAEFNGAIRPYAVYRRFGVYGGLGPSTINVGDVAFACKADETNLAHSTPVVSPDTVQVLGNEFIRSQFSCLTRRWCPDCLRESAHHRVWWDLMPVTTCPFHGVDLVARCECDTPLRSMYNFIAHCRHGHDLSEVEAPKAPADNLLADSYIVRRLLGLDQPARPHLDATPIGEIVTLAENFGRARLDLGVRLASRHDGARRDLFAAGFKALHDLDGEFVTALDEIASRDHAVRRKWGLEKTYGRFYMDLVHRSESPLRSAMLDAIAEHASTRTSLKGGKVLGRDVHNEESLTIVQAAALCEMSFERFRRLGVALDLIPASWGQGTPYRMERAKVEELAARLEGHKDLKTVADELGLSDPAAANLAREGFVTSIVEGGFNQRDLNKWIFGKDAAAELLSKLDAFVPETLETGKHLAAIPRSAQQAMTSAAKIISLIFEGRLVIKGYDETQIGLKRYLINKSEAKLVIRRERFPGLTLNEAIERIGLTGRTVASVEKHGLLKSTRHGHITIVTEEEVERFIREYATVPQLAELTGLKWGDVKFRLRRAGVDPVAERPKFEQIMYERQRSLDVLNRKME